jgi:porin
MKTMQRLHCRFGILSLALLGLAATGMGEEAEAAKSALRRWAEQDYLTGDWGGLRSELSKRGVDFEFIYVGSMPANLSGGLRQGAIYQGALMMMLDLDSQKLAGYEGGTFHASGLWLHGQKPFSDQFVGDLNKVNLVDYPNAARLWELWYQQKFYEGKLALKLGQLSIDHDFLVPELYGSLGQVSFLNQTFFFPSLPYSLFNVPGFPPGRHGLATTPTAVPGAVARWEPVKAFYLQAGVYGGEPDQTYSGTAFPLSQQAGALAFWELGYRLNQGTNHPGLEGSYKIGAYYHTGTFVDLHDGALWAAANQAQLPLPDARYHEGNYGAYLLAEQQLFSERGKLDPANQGLMAFARLLGAPSDRNLADFEADGGLVYRGPIPGRDWDTLSLAYSYLRISHNLRDAQEEVNAFLPGAFPLADYESVLELNYKIQATAWWTVQASLQRVFHPGGRVQRDIPDATVFILQTALRF